MMAYELGLALLSQNDGRLTFSLLEKTGTKRFQLYSCVSAIYMRGRAIDLNAKITAENMMIMFEFL